ncbi:hypothetical protein [Rhodococcus sp. ABRD24]|nr:hypothetical protein [Rhodococcus sp. ABRD24]
MTSLQRVAVTIAIVVAAWAVWTRLRFESPLSGREWRTDEIGPDDLAG